MTWPLWVAVGLVAWAAVVLLAARWMRAVSKHYDP